MLKWYGTGTNVMCAVSLGCLVGNVHFLGVE